MTSDIAQSNFVATANLPATGRIALTQEAGFVAGTTDIFDLLDAGTNKQTADAKRLLEGAYEHIQRLELTIGEQERRIENLQSLLTKDELTGLANRRGFFEAFNREIDRINREKVGGGLLIMIDLDNFKSINDTNGHQAGDACLKLMGAFLHSEVRDMDTAARLGGDEFLLLFPNTNREKAMRRAQTLGLRLNNLSLIWENQEIRISASLGLRDFCAGDTITDIIRDADQKLYDNKRERKSLKSLVS